MIHIDAAVDGSGLLKSCRVTGHAGAGQRGNDIVCAAVSVLTRTALKVLSEREDIDVRGAAPERGAFELESSCTGEGREFLAAAGSFLLEGLQWVSEAYPDRCTMNLHTERRQ